MNRHIFLRHFLLMATCLLPVAAQAAPITYRATGALTYVEGTTSVFSLGGTYVLDLTFDTTPDALPAPTATLAGYTLTAVSFNYSAGVYTGGTSGSVGSVTARNDAPGFGDEIYFKAGTVSGFGAVEGRPFSDDQRILDLWDRSALAWSDASTLPTLDLDMFDDYLLGDGAEMAMVWGEDDLLVIVGDVTSFAPITTVVPAPAAAWLFAGGLGILAAVRRKSTAG